MQNDGFDSMRPLPGICIQRKPAGVQELQDWNKRFSAGDLRYPRMDVHKMDKGSIASTHLNIALRCFKQGLRSAATGQVFTAGADAAALVAAVERGHLWWILSDAIPEPDALLISEWRNSDNNTSQIKHEIEYIRGIQRICRKEAELVGSTRKIVFSTVLAKAMQFLQVKTPTTTLLALAKWVVDLGAGKLVDEVCEFHSAEVLS